MSGITFKTSSFQEKVWRETRLIPRGRVTTYAALARAIGKPRAARAVGNALNQNPFPGVPCHRVVRSDGRTGGFARGVKEKIRLLRKDGVSVRSEKIDRRYAVKL